MKRTQLYLDDDLWSVLRAHSRDSNTTVSELVRQAGREKYLSEAAERKAAMQAIVGIWKDRDDSRDSTAYVQGLRKDRR